MRRFVIYPQKKYHELKDFFLHLEEDDMLNPNFSICAGIRWLFRKKELAEAITKRSLSWRDAVAAYKGLKSDDTQFMPKFDKYYKQLKGK